VGVLIGHRGIGACISLSSGRSVGPVPAHTEVDTRRAFFRIGPLFKSSQIMLQQTGTQALRFINGNSLQ